MKTAEHAIKKLLEDIDGGNIQPRAFEVLASLQKSKMEIVKHIAQFMIIIENNYKNLKFDYEANVADRDKVLPENAESTVEQPDGQKFRGTRQLMETIQDTIKDNLQQDTFEKIEEEDDEQ